MLVQTWHTWCREAAARASGKWSVLAGAGALPGPLRPNARPAVSAGGSPPGGGAPGGEDGGDAPISALVAQVELVEDLAGLGLHRVARGLQALGDGLVGEALGDQPEDLALAPRELGQRSAGPGPRDQALDDLRVDHATAVRHAAHGVEQRLDLADAVLDQVAAPRLLTLHEAQGVGELQALGEHEDADLGVLAADVLGGDEPLVGPRRRHADVDQGDVGAVALDLAIERVGIGGEARDVDAALAQQRRHAVAHVGRVVADDHADGAAVRALPLRRQDEVAPAQAAQLHLAALLEPDLLLEVGVGLGQLAHDP